MINQKIITMRANPHLSETDKLQICANSIQICRTLGLTGRVYVQDLNGLKIIEGAQDIIAEFFKALEADDRVESLIEHSCRMVSAPEFTDYQIGIDIAGPHNVEGLHVLTPEYLKGSLPASPSAHVTMMIDAYVGPIS